MYIHFDHLPCNTHERDSFIFFPIAEGGEAGVDQPFRAARRTSGEPLCVCCVWQRSSLQELLRPHSLGPAVSLWRQEKARQVHRGQCECKVLCSLYVWCIHFKRTPLKSGCSTLIKQYWVVLFTNIEKLFLITLTLTGYSVCDVQRGSIFTYMYVHVLYSRSLIGWNANSLIEWHCIEDVH